MKRSRSTEEKVTYALKLAEKGGPVKDVCRQFGVAEATFYVWRKKYAGLGYHGSMFCSDGRAG